MSLFAESQIPSTEDPTVADLRRLDGVAEEHGIARQSLSQRLRRGHHALIATTIRVTPLSAEKA